MVYFKENYNFTRFQRGSNIFRKGGGGELMIYLGVQTPYPPGSAHVSSMAKGPIFSWSLPLTPNFVNARWAGLSETLLLANTMHTKISLTDPNVFAENLGKW